MSLSRPRPPLPVTDALEPPPPFAEGTAGELEVEVAGAGTDLEAGGRQGAAVRGKGVVGVPGVGELVEGAAEWAKSLRDVRRGACRTKYAFVSAQERSVSAYDSEFASTLSRRVRFLTWPPLRSCTDKRIAKRKHSRNCTTRIKMTLTFFGLAPTSDFLKPL